MAAKESRGMNKEQFEEDLSRLEAEAIVGTHAEDEVNHLCGRNDRRT